MIYKVEGVLAYHIRGIAAENTQTWFGEAPTEARAISESVDALYAERPGATDYDSWYWKTAHANEAPRNEWILFELRKATERVVPYNPHHFHAEFMNDTITSVVRTMKMTSDEEERLRSMTITQVFVIDYNGTWCSARHHLVERKNHVH